MSKQQATLSGKLDLFVVEKAHGVTRIIPASKHTFFTRKKVTSAMRKVKRQMAKQSRKANRG